MELITKGMRKAIKTMVQVSQCARALTLLPTPEDFAMRLIGDMKIVASRVNSVSTRINEILDRYSSIPGEFLLEGFDEILDELQRVNDSAKAAIQETSDLMSTAVASTKELTQALSDGTSAVTSAAIQVGGGITYASAAIGSNVKLSMTGNTRNRITEEVVAEVAAGKIPPGQMQAEIDRRVAEAEGSAEASKAAIRNWTVTSAENSTGSIENFFDKGSNGLNQATEWIDGKKAGADSVVDNSVGKLIEKVENAKRKVEENIQRVRDKFKKFTDDFDDAFGFISGKNFAEDAMRTVSNNAYNVDSQMSQAVGEVTGEVADFIKNFNIGKVVTALGGIVVGAGAATLAMDLLPNVDVDRMLRDVIGGVDTKRNDWRDQYEYNKYYGDGPDLLEVPDVPWMLSVDDLEKYNADGYNKYLEEYAEENDKLRSEIMEKMQNANTNAERREVIKENREKMKENKSALKAMRKVRRDAIKAKQIEKYKGFLNIELEYLKSDCLNLKDTIKNEWDTMMEQYKTAIAEIKSFFTTDGSGGNDVVDRCCDRINEDATQIVELCQSLVVELSSVCTNVAVPYAIGFCFDMPVHKILEFLKDLKIVITFLKDIIRLGIDIIAQITILIKLIFGGLLSFADTMKTLKELIGADKILDMIDYILGVFQPKLIDAKILLENSLSPIYYNETEDYERRVAVLEELADADLTQTVTVEKFKYSDDPYARKKYKREFGGKTSDEDEIEDWLEELEAKGDREVVAYRSPIMNDAGDDFAGWIYYHADAYNWMKNSWSSGRKRRWNRAISKASKKNQMKGGRLVGGVAQLKRNTSFGYYNSRGKYVANSVNGFDAYYWYTEWTNDPTDCDPDFDNVEFVYDEDGNLVQNDKFKREVVSPIQTTSNGSLVEVQDGDKTMRIFVEGTAVKSGDYINVNGKKYRVK
jgi:hypothetical protein